MRNYAKRHGLSEAEIDREGEKIRDWSLSSPNGAKLNWEASWRGWVVRRLEQTPPARAGPSANGHKPPQTNLQINALKELFDELPGNSGQSAE